jgi:hypothetical protein
MPKVIVPFQIDRGAIATGIPAHVVGDPSHSQEWRARFENKS